jgi:carboxyl-terminal processing protease
MRILLFRRCVAAAAVWGLAAGFLPLSPCFPEGAGDYEVTKAKADAQQLLDKMKEAKEPEVWALERALAAMGPEAAEQVKQRLPELSGPGRLACAKMLCAVANDPVGSEELLKIVESQEPADLRIKAAELIAAYGFPEAAGDEGKGSAVKKANRLFSALEKAEAPLLSIALAKAVWVGGADEHQKTTAYETLREHLGSGDTAVRAAAAFALAELGGLQPMEDAVKSVLKPLENEPTPEGRRATALLALNRLTEYLVRDEGFDRRMSDPLLREIFELIRRYHVDERMTNPGYLVECAAKGMASHLDRFSSYMTRAEWKQFKEGMSGTYAGIGALVRESDGKAIVERVFHFGPAYKAGIRSFDEIIKLDGKEVAGAKTREIADALRGDPETPVKITVKRKRQEQPLEFEVKREEIHVPAVEYAGLPGEIGYLRLTGFGDDSAKEVEQALKQLEEKQGVRGLILDLRGNPGGLITAAQQVANLFLPGDKLIVYSEGRNQEVAPRRDLRTVPEVQARNCPLVVLVDGDSASASEIVAGALQDHKRAALVGERTYGKGSVQQLMPLESTEKTSALRLTIAKYFLPSGRCIHEVGVEPDIRAAPKARPAFEDPKVRALPESHLHDYYLDRKEKHKELLEKLAESDGGKPDAYPDFEPWYASLGTQAPKDAVRDILRQTLRRLIADERGKDFVYDVVEDTQLQAGIRELAKRMGLDLAKFELYGVIGPEETGKDK